jgi:uncharacterized membrane protein YcaP (DUF421 family)
MDVERFFFDGAPPLVRTLVVGVLAYVGLVVLLRASGKRTLSKLNAFDFVVTVALGSTLATVLLSKDVSLAQGLLAFALLVLLQFLITWSSVRIRWVRNAVTGEPALLLYQGRVLGRALIRTRVTEDEVRAAVRSAGLTSLEEAQAVVLETDGSISVVKTAASGADAGSLAGVRLPDER